ncbi:amidohydrolase [Halobacteriales archaeon QH_10_67_13]|nr:MAG: amidohydrolase [Halobacteriales archaeon QH_10_67_13]
MLELEHGFRVIDAHVELEPDQARRRPDGAGPEQIERELRQAGIVRGLVHPPARATAELRERNSYLRTNNAIARMAVDRSFDALARVAGGRAPGSGPGARLRNVARSRESWQTSPGDIEQYAYDERFAGFMLDPTADGLPGPAVLERLAEVDRPVLTYGGRGFPPERIESTLLEYEFPLIVAHFGGYPLDEELMGAAIELLGRHERCFLDTSYVRLREYLERAVMEHPDRVVFGSGAPAAHPNVAAVEILTLDVPEDAMRKIFAKNLERAFEGAASEL